MKSEMIRRDLRLANSQIRADENGKKTIEGFIPYNSRSEDLGGFYEYIAPSAFTKTLKDGADVKCLYNHDSSMLLGRTKNGSLRLESREDGLHIECDLPETSYGNDAYVQVRDALNNGLSFGFWIIKQDIGEEEIDGQACEVHTLKEVRLFEVSFCVTFPAYSETDAKARSLRSVIDDLDQLSVDDLKALKDKVDSILKEKEPPVKPDTSAEETTEDETTDKALEALKNAIGNLVNKE